MPKSLEEKYKDLQARVKILEEENDLLSERAEETLLLRLVAETINYGEEKESLLSTLLEKISILKDLPLIACYSIKDKTAEHISSYSAFSVDKAPGVLVKITKIFHRELEHGASIFPATDARKKGLTIKYLNKGFLAQTICIIPFESRLFKKGFFIFFDRDKQMGRLKAISLLLIQIIDMIIDKLDKIVLVNELKELNAELETRVKDRTQELHQSNLTLKDEIEKRKQIQKDLEDNEAKFRGLFNNANDAIYLWDLNPDGSPGRCLEVNDIAVKMLGFSRKEILSFTPYDINPDAEKKMIPQTMKKLVSKSAATFETIHLTKKGIRIPVEINSHIFTLQGKKVILSITRDISKRREVEIALKESEEKYRELFMVEKDAIIIIDPESRKIIDSNRATTELYGYSKKELLTMSALALSAEPEYAAAKIKEVSRMSQRSRFVDFTRHKKKNGEIFPVEISAGRFMLRSRKMNYVIIRDITEKVSAEEKIRKLSRSVEQSPASIVITDLQGDIEYVNPKFEEITGYSSKEVLGKNPRILKSGDMPQEKYTELWETIATGKEWQGEFHNKKKNGELYWEYASISPIKNEKGETTHYLAVKENTTEQRQLQEQLNQAQKMESIGTLAGGIAHDFNNLLTVINGHAELSAMKITEDHPAHSDIVSILEAGKRAEDLTGKLLAFSRKQIYEAKVLNINQIIAGLDKMLRRLIGEDIQIETILKFDVPRIKADPGQIEQILINLVVNARDAINEKRGKSADRKISIKTEVGHYDQTKSPEYSSGKSGDFLIISVIDSGIGMSDELKNKIFEPFFTTKEVGRGTGLGMATVYGIVKQNFGFIDVHSVVGEGTTFNIYWPVTTEEDIEQDEDVFDRSAIIGSESILLVEDDHAVREFGLAVLEDLGYTVSEAADGKKALQLFKKREMNFDLVITDLVMPEMNGKELVKELRSITPDLKVVYASGYTDEHISQNGSLAKGINFIHKPYSPYTLAKKVRDVLDNK